MEDQGLVIADTFSENTFWTILPCMWGLGFQRESPAPEKSPNSSARDLGVFQRPLILILLQKYHGHKWEAYRAIRIGGVYTTFCQKD